ncbi:MAG: hypothetical protein QOD00_855 [Blastocatellia bacterium]|jgi:hypothetical protein|nr:hypothetical protein [Blastocatellia bacterium]
MSDNQGTEQQQQQANQVDDRGTSESEGRAILKHLRDRGFEESDEKLAVALGRPIEEVQGWTGGAEPVDDDVIMKARGIAKERGIEVE